MTRTWPFDNGLMSRNARVNSFSKTFKAGIVPFGLGFSIL